jgi:uncharacterized membrane protein YkvA (DUF1232 family)
MGNEWADLEGIPEAAKPLWTTLCAEELRPVHELFKEVRDYQQTIKQRSQWRDADVDPTLANTLAEASLRLLGTLKDASPESTRRLVQAAVRYFVIEEDADSDLDSILGLDDDAEVLNAVLRKLGHADWQIDVP